MNEKTASPPHLRVGMVFVRGLLSGLLARGVDCSPWLRTVGIDPAELMQDTVNVTAHQYAELFRVLIRDLDDEGLSLLNRRMKPGSFALQMRAAVGAETLEAAIKRMLHVLRLLNDDLEFVYRETDRLAGLELHFHDPEIVQNRFVHEQHLRIYWRAMAWLVGGNLPVVRFDFAFPRPAYAEGYNRIFPAPWTFDARYTAMWFELERMQHAVCRDDNAMREFIAHSPFNLILPRRDLGYSERVRVHLRHTVPSWPDLEATARVLNMSPSSLQRHLAAEGTTFRELRDQLKRDIAIFKLNTSQTSLGHLASELGFADVAAFQRAFKSWTGYPPGEFRRAGKKPER